MTPPSTPAGWYPDPDGSGGQRYWDGYAWTEHRSPGAHATPEPSESPAPAEPPAAEQPTVVVPTMPAAPKERVGAHRKPEPEPELEPSEPEPGPTAPVAQRIPPPFVPTFEPTPPPVETGPPPPIIEPTYGHPTPADNRKLIVWFGAACAALLAVLVLVLVYAFVIHRDNTVQIASPGDTTTSKPAAPTTTGGGRGEPTQTATDSPTTVAGAGDATDGALSFTVHGFDVVPTVTSSDAPVEKTAQGEFVVVRLTVTNTGDAPTPFLGNYQRLNAAGITYYPDDEATFDVGGGVAELNPGDAVDVAVAFDVPPGTVPESIELHGGQMSPGVQLPL